MTDVFSVILEHLWTALDYGNIVAASFFFLRGAETLHIYFNFALFQNSLVSWTYCFQMQDKTRRLETFSAKTGLRINLRKTE